MSYRHTFEAALESLLEIEDLVKGFPGNGNIPAIDIDLALQKTRNLYELLLMVKNQREEAAEITATEVKKEPVVAASHSPSPKQAKTSKEPQTLGDKFRGGSTLHESFHKAYNKEDDTLAHVKPVVNLLTAIGLNDRFTFVKELFNNDTASFENTIIILNESASFNDAYNHMIQHFEWDMDSEPVQLLLDIIRRKFIKGSHE